MHINIHVNIFIYDNSIFLWFSSCPAFFRTFQLTLYQATFLHHCIFVHDVNITKNTHHTDRWVIFRTFANTTLWLICILFILYIEVKINGVYYFPISLNLSILACVSSTAFLCCLSRWAIISLNPTLREYIYTVCLFWFFLIPFQLVPIIVSSSELNI